MYAKMIEYATVARAGPAILKGHSDLFIQSLKHLHIEVFEVELFKSSAMRVPDMPSLRTVRVRLPGAFYKKLWPKTRSREQWARHDNRCRKLVRQFKQPGVELLQILEPQECRCCGCKTWIKEEDFSTQQRSDLLIELGIDPKTDLVLKKA